MIITHDPEKHIFTAYNDDNTRMGEIGYSPQGAGRILATHTRVEDAFQGRGIARELLDALAAHAEKEGLVITPLCSYVIAQFEKDPARYAKVAAE